MLMGLGYRPQSSLAALDYMDHGNALAAFGAIQQATRHLVQTLPTLRDYLTERYRHDNAYEQVVT